MLMPPMFSSLMAFGLAVLLLVITRKKRSESKFIHFGVLGFAFSVSIVLSSYTSSNPGNSGAYLFSFWIGYPLFSFIFLRRKKKASVIEAE